MRRRVETADAEETRQGKAIAHIAGAMPVDQAPKEKKGDIVQAIGDFQP
jgi:hypothetical protein